MRKIKVPIYNSEVIFVYNEKELKKYIKDGDIKNCDGKFYENNGNGVIYIGDKKSGTLIHEIIHYAIYLLQDRGVEISYRNDECITYLAEYIYNQFIKKK